MSWKNTLTCLMSAGVLMASPVMAEAPLTKAGILEVIHKVDEAARNRDTDGIGRYLAKDFVKYVDVPAPGLPATARLDKPQYLKLIDMGWSSIEAYDYDRSDVVINIAADGLSAESKSTIVETMTVDGRDMVSKVREYASYRLEDGRAVILMVEGHTLVGDTTPQ